MKRREFGEVLASILGSWRAGLLFFKPGYVEAANLPLIAEKDSLAKTLGYCANAAKPGPSCKTRKDAPNAGQFCGNCQLYTKAKGSSSKEVGNCLLIAGKFVSVEGWCRSWMKKGTT